VSGETTCLFYALDTALTREQRARVASLSRRANPTGRSVEFSYQVGGYDIPGGHVPLLAKYYDVMVRSDYSLWTLGMSFPFTKSDKESLDLFACDNGEGVGIEVTIPKETRGKEKRIVVEIRSYLDYEKAYRLNLGAPALPWEHAEDDDGDGVWFGRGGDDLQEQLACAAAAFREAILEKGDYRALYAAWESLRDEDDEEERDWIPAKPRNQGKMPPYMKKWSELISKEP